MSFTVRKAGTSPTIRKLKKDARSLAQHRKTPYPEFARPDNYNQLPNPSDQHERPPVNHIPLYIPQGKLPHWERSLTEDEIKHIDKLILKSKFKQSPNFDKLKDLTEKVYKQMPDADKGAVCRILKTLGTDCGMFDNSVEASILEGINTYLKQLEIKRRDDPINIALDIAEQQKRDAIPFKTIAYTLAIKGVPKDDTVRRLLKIFDEKSENIKAVDDGYNAIHNNFAKTPGAVELEQNPTPAQLLTVLENASEPAARFIPVELFDRLINMLHDAESGYVIVPEPEYVSFVDRECERIRKNRTSKQLDESARRVAISSQGVNIDILAKLCSAFYND